MDTTQRRTLRWIVWTVLIGLGLGLIGLGVRVVRTGDPVSGTFGIGLLILGFGLGYASNGMAQAVARRWVP